MSSDNYKIWEIVFGGAWRWRGKLVSRTEGNTDNLLVGGNASAEGSEVESTESAVITAVDIVLNHPFQETSSTKEAYRHYIKDPCFDVERPGKLSEKGKQLVTILGLQDIG
ncbi:hypothetical protein GH733_001416 [Mirounga leonina]|nr:hypothetical protein GH733_001416 [Mirounga leonina]